MCGFLRSEDSNVCGFLLSYMKQVVLIALSSKTCSFEISLYTCISLDRRVLCGLIQDGVLSQVLWDRVVQVLGLEPFLGEYPV